MPDSPVVTTMREFKRLLAAREARQVQAMTARWMALESRLAAQIELLARVWLERFQAGEEVSQAALFRFERYQALLAQVQAELEGYAVYADGLIANGQREMLQLGIGHAGAAIDATTGGAVGFMRLPIEAVENMAGLLADGSPLRSLLLNAAKQAECADRMTSALLEGTALGWNPRKTARAMGDGLAGGMDQALTVARSEQLRVYREANRQAMAASGLVAEYMRLVTKDTRTCMACMVRDGERIAVERPLDEHPNGRCAQVPVVVGFEPPQWQSASDWFMTRSAEQQRAMMGTARWEAWRRGEFELSDLAQSVHGREFGPGLRSVALKALVNR